MLISFQAMVREGGSQMSAWDIEHGHLPAHGSHTLQPGSVVWDVAIWQYADGEFKESERTHRHTDTQACGPLHTTQNTLSPRL